MTIAIIIAAIGWGLAARCYWGWCNADARVWIGHQIIDEQNAEIAALTQPRDARGRFGSKPSIKQEVR